MPVSAKIRICISFQASVFLGSKTSPLFLVAARYLTKISTTGP